MILDFSKGKQYSLNVDRNCLKYWELSVIKFLDDWFSDERKVSVKTSGSTGRPKIFEIEKVKMQYSARITCDFLGLKQGDIALHCLPIEYISGKMMLVRAIERRLKVIIKKPSINPLADLDTPIDFCAMTPLQVENSLEKLNLIKNLIIGGATVSENLKNKIIKILNSNIEKTNIKIFETYGMSETLSHIALKMIFPKKEDYFSILEGIQINQDKRGCLTIFAPNLNPETLITNDLVKIKNERKFKFLGRVDNIINSGGAKISPEILEEFVKKIIPNELVFVGIPDEILGQKLILIIEGKEDLKLKSEILTLKFEKDLFRPKEIFFIEKIPRTPNGKVNRLGLIEILKDYFLMRNFK